MGYLEKYNLWLESVKDEKLKTELESMTDEQKSTAFFKHKFSIVPLLLGILNLSTSTSAFTFILSAT